MQLWGFVGVSENRAIKLRKFTNSKQVDAKVEPRREKGHNLIRMTWIAVWYPGTDGNKAGGSTAHSFHEIVAIRLICYWETRLRTETWTATEKTA